MLMQLLTNFLKLPESLHDSTPTSRLLKRFARDTEADATLFLVQKMLGGGVSCFIRLSLLRKGTLHACAIADQSSEAAHDLP